MKGGPFHNNLIRQPEAFLRGYGAMTALEHGVAGWCRGSVDLYAEFGGSTIVVEVELRSARLAKDILKALALEADLLIVLVPTTRLARLFRPRIEVLKVELKAQALDIYCQTLPLCLQTLARFCQDRMSDRQLDSNTGRSS